MARLSGLARREYRQLLRSSGGMGKACHGSTRKISQLIFVESCITTGHHAGVGGEGLGGSELSRERCANVPCSR